MSRSFLGDFTGFAGNVKTPDGKAKPQAAAWSFICIIWAARLLHGIGRGLFSLYKLDNEKHQPIADSIHRRHDPRGQWRAGDQRLSNVECVAHMEGLHQKSANGQIGGKAEEGAVPFFVGDVEILEHQKRHGKGGRQAVVQESGNGWKVEKGNVLIHKGGIDHGGNAAEQSQQPSKMQGAIVFLSQKDTYGQHKAGHTAKTVWDDAVPSDLIVAKYLRQPVRKYGCEKQSCKDLQDDFLRLFCFGALFAKQQAGGGNHGTDNDVKDMFCSE